MNPQLTASGPAAWNLRASAALRAGELADAEQQLRLSIAAEPRRGDSRHMLGLVLEATRRFEEAAAAFTDASRLEPGTSPPLLGLARVREALGERAAAEDLYRRALVARGAGAEPRWRLAAMLMEQGRSDEADALLAPLDSEVLSAPAAALRVAEAERSAGRSPAALDRLAAAYRDHPNGVSLASAYAVLLEEAGRFEAALAVREAALRENSDSPPAQNAVAWTLSELGRELDRALELAERASRGSDAAPEFLDTLAAVHLKRGDPASALAAVNRAVEIAGETVPPRLLYMRAAALAGSGRAGEARVALGGCFEALEEASPIWLPAARQLAERLDVPTATRPPGRL